MLGNTSYGFCAISSSTYFVGGSQAGSSGGSGSAGMKSIPFHRPVLQQNSIDMLVSRCLI